MKKNQNEKGAAFERYWHLSGMKGVDIAHRLGLANPQNLTHWANRGVPAKNAFQVAALLGCRADEISNVTVDPTAAEEITGYAAKKREVREALIAIIEETDDPKLLDLLLENARLLQRTFSG